ncbi:MAG: TetR/AcrR family transcriptional regulator [Spirochaetaceae bacterium]|nr:TetR/AcrR family transcriptional regulator [Spirochaetaceae bacterium]
MARAFSEEEKTKIKESLLDAAQELISRQGVQKTTVDEIVDACHIAKGSFYAFYKTKELLFWDVILRWHSELEDMMFGRMQKITQITEENLSDFIYDAYMLCFDCGLGYVITNGDIEYLIRKLPSEVVDAHIANEDDRLIKLLMQLPQFESLDADLFSAAFRGLFLMLPYKKEIGPRFEEVFKLCIRGVVRQMFSKPQKGDAK